MGYRTREGLYYCTIDDFVIFLDLPRDRYFAISGQSGEFFQAFVAGQHNPEHLQVLTRLELVEEGTAIEARIPPPDSASSAIDAEWCPPPSLLIIKAIAAQLLARLELRFRELQHVVADLRQAKVSAQRRGKKATTVADVRMIAFAFHRSRRYVRSHDTCLARGVAMTRMLGRLGCYPDMILGVGLPFAAHCWVQVDGEALTDPLHRVRSFTPILAV